MRQNVFERDRSILVWNRELIYVFADRNIELDSALLVELHDRRPG